MVVDSLLATIQALPKIELHRHLEGSVRLQTLVEIAEEYEIEMPEYEVETLRPFVQMMPGEPRDWQHFLGKFHTLRQFYRSPEIIKRVTREAVADAAADNVKYLELRFTPRALINIIDCSYEDVVTWVCETANETAEECGIQVRMILSMNRHESVEIGEEVLQAAIDHCHQGIVGLDLAGQEADHPADPFRAVFKRARDAGLGLTIHAGEWGGAENVREAVLELGASRVGHGIRALEDETLVELLVERGTVLEVCPSSNVDTGIVANLGVHPLPQLYRKQVRTTINTDDPLLSNLTLSGQMARLVTQTSLTLEDVKQHILTAAQAAFLPDSERQALVARFQAWLNPATP